MITMLFCGKELFHRGEKKTYALECEGVKKISAEGDEHSFINQTTDGSDEIVFRLKP